MKEPNTLHCSNVGLGWWKKYVGEDVDGVQTCMVEALASAEVTTSTGVSGDLVEGLEDDKVGSRNR
jgi:hypothetical protein